MDIGATKMVVAVQILKLAQNGKEVDSLKIFKEQPWIFAQSGIICSYWPPLILVEVLKKYKNGLQCKMHSGPEKKKLIAGLKIFYEWNIFLHKSDLKTSHDISKFLWEF